MLLCLVLLHLAQPLVWAPSDLTSATALWFPPAGIGLALVAWFGPGIALWVFADGLLAVGQAALLAPEAASPAALGAAAIDAALLPAALVLGWRLYREAGGSGRAPSGPRSAILFLALVPGLALGLAALVHALALGLATGDLTGALGLSLAQWWMVQALGACALAPPLLVLGTPALERRGWVRLPLAVRSSVGTEDLAGGDLVAEHLGPGDWLEIVALAAATAVCTLLAIPRGGGDLSGPLGGWHLWGAPLLFIVWASMRKGLRGGTVAAAAATAGALIALSLLSVSARGAGRGVLVQGNLLAQCGTALLVAASVAWVRAGEVRYRQVVSHVPVVLYSARLPAGPVPILAAAAKRPRPPSPRAQDLLGANVVLVSAAAQSCLGCPADQLLGNYSSWLHRVHPDDHEVVVAALAQLVLQEQPVTCEYRLVPRSGAGAHRPLPEDRPRWVRDTMVPQRDAEGRLGGWDGVVTDITEQRHLSDDLRRTTSMLHALVSNLPAGVFFVQGPHGQPILVNARARQLLGREDTAAGLEHMAQVYRLFRPDGSPYPVEDLPVYRALRDNIACMRDDIVVHRPDGRRLSLVSWAAPVTFVGSQGQRRSPDAAVWVLEDLTALHQAEAARSALEGQLRTVVETMAEGLLVLDRDAAIIEANPTAAALLGLPPEQLRGRVMTKLGLVVVREDGAPLPADEYPSRVALRTGRPVRNFVVGIAAPGSPLSIRWALVNAMPLPVPVGSSRSTDVSGRPALVITLADITAQVHA